MSIPSRPLSQDPQSQLLWNISKQLEQLIGVVSKLVVTTTTTTTVAPPTTTTTTTTIPITTTTTTTTI
jgi:hypothetical protein